MCLSISYFIIPAITVFVALVGRYFSQRNMGWYATLKLPSFTPQNKVFAFVWPVIFVTSTIAALYVWNGFAHTSAVWVIMLLFGAVALANLAWTYTFFHRHEIGLSVLENALYFVVLSVLFYLAYSISFLVMILLVPHLAWIIFAFFLNVSVWVLNR